MIKTRSNRAALDLHPRNEGTKTFRTDYFGSGKSLEETPQAFLVEVVLPGAVIHPHFHRVPQFQIVIAGGGRIGKHPLEPVAVHYVDAFTPYGPIIPTE